MAKINSPLGSKNFQSGMREFVIPDESDMVGMDEQQYEDQQASFYQNQQMPQQPQQKVNYREHMQQRSSINSAAKDTRISDGARKRIEMLCGMTKMTKSVQIGDVNFIISSIRTKDNRDALLASIKYDGTVEFSFELRKQILARSLIQVSDVEIDMFLGTNDFQARLDFLDELDDAVCNRLYSEYLELDKEIKEKYSLKNEKDAKEAVEDIKK